MATSKYYIFDLFGTLITGSGAEIMYIEALNGLFPGLEHWNVNQYINTKDFGSAEVCISKALKHFNITATSEQLKKFEEITNSWKKEIHMYDEVEEVVTGLKKRGAKLGMITNDSNIIAGFIENFGLEKYFDVIISSYKVGMAKPDPRIYELCVEKLGAQMSEVIMVGDKLDRDVEPPNKLGMRGILYDPEQKNLKYPDRISNLKELLN